MRLVGVFLLLGILVGCGKSQPVSQAVAKVGANTLYQDEVDYRLQRFSEAARQQILQNKSQYTEFIESVAYAKLMADKQWAGLPEEQRNLITQQIEAYRIDLLSRDYLETNLPVVQPNSVQIEEYYKAHPDLFSAKEYQVQVIRVREGCSVAPEFLMKKLNKSQFDQLMKSECLALLNTKTLSHNELKQLSEQQVINERHAYWTQLDNLTRLLFVEKITVNTKPLSEVANDIRETLAAKSFKEAFDAYRAILSKEIELLN